MRVRLTMLMMIVLLGSAQFSVSGCEKKSEDKEKTVMEKLNSDNPDEQKQGLDEANEVYGGGQ